MSQIFHVRNWQQQKNLTQLGVEAEFSKEQYICKDNLNIKNLVDNWTLPEIEIHTE